jgi:parallel beta-helix repeat protein
VLKIQSVVATLKKAVMALSMILCLLFVPCLKDYKTSIRADPGTVNVPGDFSSIQQAVNNVSSGDTIFVHTGIYSEHVVINKSIALVGENRDSTIIDGSQSGNVIYIVNTANVTIEGFTVRGSGLYPNCGIFVDHSVYNTIMNNIVIDNAEGISLLSSSGNVICDNNISNNNDGICLFSSSDNVISRNTISLSNYDGIYLYYSVNNVVSRNFVLYNNLDGISLYYSSSNVICGNTVLNNYYGIISFYSNSNNTIYHNNFNNTHQVWGDLVNFWDHDGEGNYWSDYSGQDLNRDGLGDVPYLIDETYRDNHPLMGAFSDFDVSLEGETYDVTVVSNSTISTFKFEIGRETRNRIIRFNATVKDDTAGFCRVRIPTKLMNYSYIVLIDGEEIIPTLLNVSNETYVYLYFTYLHKTNAITIIYSEALHLYDELLNRYLKLQMDLYNLNVTYYVLLGNYNTLLSNYTQLQTSFNELNNSYQTLVILNITYDALSYNYSQLQTSFDELEDAYREHLMEYSEQVQNLRNLTYILAAIAAIFIVTTIYLSKRAHARITTKSREVEGE